MSHLTTLFIVGPDEYVEFNESLGSKAMLQHVWDHQTTPLDKKDTASTRLHSSGARISPTPPPKIEFPTLKRIKGKGNNYQPTGKWFPWEELARRNPLAVNPPPSIESLRNHNQRGENEKNTQGDRSHLERKEDLGIGTAPRVQPGSWLAEEAKKPKLLDGSGSSDQIGTTQSRYATTPLNLNGAGASKYASSPSTTAMTTTQTSKPAIPSKSEAVSNADNNASMDTSTEKSTSSDPPASGSPQYPSRLTSSSNLKPSSSLPNPTPSTTGGISSIDALLQRVRMYSRSANSNTSNASPSTTSASTSADSVPVSSKVRSTAGGNNSDKASTPRTVSTAIVRPKDRHDEEEQDVPIPSLAFRLGPKSDEIEDPEYDDSRARGNTPKQRSKKNKERGSKDESQKGKEKERSGSRALDANPDSSSNQKYPLADNEWGQSVSEYDSGGTGSDGVEEIEVKIPTGPKAQAQALQSGPKSKNESQPKKEREKEKHKNQTPPSASSSSSVKVEATSAISVAPSSSTSSSSKPEVNNTNKSGAKRSTFKEEFDPTKAPPTGPSKRVEHVDPSPKGSPSKDAESRTHNAIVPSALEDQSAVDAVFEPASSTSTPSDPILNSKSASNPSSNSGTNVSRWAHSEEPKFKPFDKSQIRLAFKSGPGADDSSEKEKEQVIARNPKTNSTDEKTKRKEESQLPPETPTGPKADRKRDRASTAKEQTTAERKREKGEKQGKKSLKQEEKSEQKEKGREKQKGIQHVSTSEHGKKHLEQDPETGPKESEKNISLKSESATVHALTPGSTAIDDQSSDVLAPASVQMERRVSATSEISNAETIKSRNSDVEGSKKKSKSRKEKKVTTSTSDRHAQKVITPSSSNESSFLSKSNLTRAEAQLSQPLPSSPTSRVKTTSGSSSSPPGAESMIDGEEKDTPSATISSSAMPSSASSNSLSFSSNINWADDDEDDTLPDLEDWGISGINANSSPSKSIHGAKDSIDKPIQTTTEPKLQWSGLHSDRLEPPSSLTNSGSEVEGSRNVNKRGSKRAGKGRGTKKEREAASSREDSADPSHSIVSRSENDRHSANGPVPSPPTDSVGVRIAGRASASQNSSAKEDTSTPSTPRINASVSTADEKVASKSDSSNNSEAMIPSGPRSSGAKAMPYWSTSAFASNQSSSPLHKTNNNHRGMRAGTELLSHSSRERDSTPSKSAKDRASINHSRPRIMAGGGGAFSRLTKGIVAVNDEKTAR